MSGILHCLLSAGPGLFAFNVTAASNVDLRTAAISAGWNGQATLRATVTGALTASSAAFAALTIAGSFPNGVKVVNNSTITGFNGANGAAGINGASGAGGVGGAAGSAGVSNPGANGSAGGTAGNGGAGGSGSTALTVSVPVTFDNVGSIVRGIGGTGGAPGTQSGGGGGGGGSTIAVIGSGKTAFITYVAGPDGGAGYSVSTGAAGLGTYTGTSPDYSFSGAGGASGVAGNSGGGSAGSANVGTPGAGAAGGAAGSAGGTGANGYCITGNSNITYINTGTRTGTIV